jgi:hypothetical protein
MTKAWQKFLYFLRPNSLDYCQKIPGTVGLFPVEIKECENKIKNNKYAAIKKVV